MNRARAIPETPEIPEVTVVGLPADGWTALGEPSRAALVAAAVVVGAPRQLGLLPEAVTAVRVELPSPLRPGLRPLLAAHRGSRVVVLASGDPMHYGIGRTLVEELGAAAVHVVPAVSATALACARLRWPVESVSVVSVVGRPLACVGRALYDRARVLVLSAGAESPGQVLALLGDRGFGASVVTLLEDLGAGSERVSRVSSDTLPPSISPLNIVAVECRHDGRRPRPALTPGLDDTAYENDGQLTKRHVRAVTLSTLAPAPGELLWDIGGGSGSIAIEWLRSHPACRAVSVERRADRAERIGRNAAALGVPGLDVLLGRAPEALVGLEPPDAVFVGGGLTTPGMLDAVVAALRPGGRLVANTVVIESEALVLEAFRRWGGDLARIDVAQPSRLGGHLAWQAARPVTQWSMTKSLEAEGQ